MDPKMNPESSNMRVFPVFLAFDAQNIRVLPYKTTSKSSKMAPRGGSRKRPFFGHLYRPSDGRFTRVLCSKMSIVLWILPIYTVLAALPARPQATAKRLHSLLWAYCQFIQLNIGKMHNRNNGIMRLYRVFPYILQKCLFLHCFTI